MTRKVFILFIQTLLNDCSHIEDVHLLFCACFIIFFHVLTGVELRHFFHPQCLGARCLVCVICNSNSIYSFILKLCTMIIHTLKIRTSYFVHVSYFFLILMGVALGHFFPTEMLRGCLVCVICNSNSIYSFIFKLCIMIVHTLKICTSYFVKLFHFFIILMGVELRHFSHLSVRQQHFRGAKFV